MSRKTRPLKRSSLRKSAERQLLRRSDRFDRRTLVIACFLLASLIATVIYARRAPTKSSGTTEGKSTLSKKDAANPVKNIKTLLADELAAIPPEALHPTRPEAAGYNASRGGLPPGALPPGVVLPGITDTGRTTAQGYGVYDGVRQQFTGKERDSETGLDYFGARYYSAVQGRFTSPDAPLVDQFPENPQSWNLYSYTRNNPVRVADKDGRITPLDILDVVSLAMSVRDFWRKPSWSNAGWVAADLIGAAAPLLPVGSIRRAKQLSDIVGAAASTRNLQNATEVMAYSRISENFSVLAAGDNHVRGAVGMAADGKVADILAFKDNKFLISEVKGGHSPDIGDAVGQLRNTAKHVADNLISQRPSLEISRLEVVIHKGAKIGDNFQISGDQLLQFNSATKRFEPVRIQGRVVHVVQIPPPPEPSSVPKPPLR